MQDRLRPQGLAVQEEDTMTEVMDTRLFNLDIIVELQIMTAKRVRLVAEAGGEGEEGEGGRVGGEDAVRADEAVVDKFSRLEAE